MGKIRLFIDTNILVDFFSGRRRDGMAEKIIRIGNTDVYEACTSILSAANVVYLKKYYNDDFKASDVSSVVKILPLSDEEWRDSCLGPTMDFEDNLQISCAINNECAAIITRDKHFSNSPIKSYSPEEFLGVMY